MAGTSTPGAVVLPSVSTILAPTSCSVNAALMSVLSVPETSLAAIPLQTGQNRQLLMPLRMLTVSLKKVRLIPPATKNAVRIRLIVSFCLW